MSIYGIKDSANFTLKYKSGANKGKVFLYSDYATVATNEWSSEQVYAKSKSVNAIRWDFGRASTLKADMEIFDLKWIALLAGSDFVTGAKDILKREVLTLGSDKTASLAGTVKTGSLTVYKLDEDGLSNGDELKTGDNAGYTIAEKKITVTGGAEGDKIVAYYLENQTSAQTLTISADKYPENFEIFADTTIRDTDGKDKFVQVNYLNVKPKSQFTLTFDASNITTISAEFDVLKDTGSSDMATYTIYE